MADTKFIGIGIGIAVISVVISVFAIASAPSVEAIDYCEESGDSQDEWEGDTCETLMAEDETAMIFFFLLCCLGFPAGAVVAGIGLFKTDPNAQSAQIFVQQMPGVQQTPVVQPVAYMAPAQTGYAPPVAAQPAFGEPSRVDVELELKKRRMRNVDTLTSEGRLMEAAMEAESAGEHAMAAQLRTQAENKLRQDNTPETPQEDHYLVYLTTALADGFLSIQEEKLLETQRNTLGISWDTHIRLLTEMGYSHEQLKQYQQAKTFEDSGRFIEAAAIYESMGNLDKAQMLRMKAKMLEGGAAAHTTYNISDSVMQGKLDEPPR